MRVGPVLDEVDKRIVEALQEDGRASFRRVATEIGVSEATVRARYSRLAAANVVQVLAVTNPLELGFEAMTMVGVNATGPPEPVADEIARWPEASYVVITAGRYDVLVELVCADRRQLLELTNRIRAVEGVASTESFVYLQLQKQLYNWGARP
jgi:Lrp/AsnC family transcriptional regulator, regulator for asnA, asnC and gidA